MAYLKQMKAKAKKAGDVDKLNHFRELIGSEKQLKNKIENFKKEQSLLGDLKNENKERVQKGLDPVFKKKRDVKNMQFMKKFDDLEKSGKLEKFMKSREEENDKKRQRVR